jgi:mono/diheme cytochrome c family protein
MKHVALFFAAILALSGTAAAQDSDVRAGRVTAETNCVECHVVRGGQPVLSGGTAPSFERIANAPGMSPLALQAALQTSHRTMPNVILEPDELRGIVRYILTLRRD